MPIRSALPLPPSPTLVLGTNLLSPFPVSPCPSLSLFGRLLQRDKKTHETRSQGKRMNQIDIAFHLCFCWQSLANGMSIDPETIL